MNIFTKAPFQRAYQHNPQVIQRLTVDFSQPRMCRQRLSVVAGNCCC